MPAGVAGILLALTVLLRSVAAAEPPPNIVLVVFDTLRPDHLGIYGYERETAPFLAELAGGGVVFTQALSTSSWTAPACASLFTSLYPIQHGVVRGFRAHKAHVERILESGGAEVEINRIPDAITTLPEILRRRGYRTFGITANINMGEAIGFDRGFDRFVHLTAHEPYAGVPASEKDRAGKRRWNDATDVSEHVERWSNEIRSSRPFFLYLHFNDPHAPYFRRNPWFREPPAGVRRDTEAGARALARARYDSEIGYADAELRRIDELLGLRDNSVIIVASDHGEAFGEHGRSGHGPGLGLWAVANRVLLMMHTPGENEREAVRVDAPVSLIDVLPTITELAGAEDDGARSGVSLAAYLRATTGKVPVDLGHRALFSHVVGSVDPPRSDRRGVVHGGWKLIVGDGKPRLFALDADPEERDNRARSHAGLVDELMQRIADHVHATSAGETTEVTIDAAGLERLRALGYVD